MGDVIRLEEWPTAVRDRRRFYLDAQPLDDTDLSPRALRRLHLAVWLFTGERPAQVYVDDIDRLMCTCRGRRLVDLVARPLRLQLSVWYSEWALVEVYEGR